jgi:hypothetical protein
MRESADVAQIRLPESASIAPDIAEFLRNCLRSIFKFLSILEVFCGA